MSRFLWKLHHPPTVCNIRLHFSVVAACKISFKRRSTHFFGVTRPLSRTQWAAREFPPPPLRFFCGPRQTAGKAAKTPGKGKFGGGEGPTRQLPAAPPRGPLLIETPAGTGGDTPPLTPTVARAPAGVALGTSRASALIWTTPPHGPPPRAACRCSAQPLSPPGRRHARHPPRPWTLPLSPPAALSSVIVWCDASRRSPTVPIALLLSLYHHSWSPSVFPPQSDCLPNVLSSPPSLPSTNHGRSNHPSPPAPPPRTHAAQWFFLPPLRQPWAAAGRPVHPPPRRGHQLPRRSRPWRGCSGSGTAAAGGARRAPP